jgi:c-di-GMP-binding flagellar brake protein YcgR
MMAALSSGRRFYETSEGEREISRHMERNMNSNWATSLLSSTHSIRIAQTERRQWKRYCLAQRVAVVNHTPQGFQVYSGQARDISQGGIAVYLLQATPLEIGDLVLLEFVLPGAVEPIRIEAAIRKRVGFLYRFEFSRSTSVERKLIRQTCSLRESKY